MVKVDGAVKKELSLSVKDLKARYKQHEVTCALQCAGLRRHTMRTFLKEVSGIDWGDGAVMNCTWKGPKLKDILNEAGIDLIVHKTGHVAFACYYTKVQEDDWYGGSILLSRAMKDDGDVMLALEVLFTPHRKEICDLAHMAQMNGEPLNANHGYPVRAIVPGIAGCRSVKWLQRITVQEEESDNFYQQYDYKILPPQAVDAETAKQYWHITPGLQDMPVNSIIAIPQNEEIITLPSSGNFEVRGYALPYGDQGPVTKVEVSTDHGRKWVDAKISEESKKGSKWSWALWSATVTLSKGNGRRILSRAVDAGGNTQDPHPKWNLRGVVYNGYGESRNLTIQ